MRNPFKRAFTLIEMLVVIAVIGVLAALLFPALGKARTAARSTKCMANLRQLQMSVMVYYDGGSLPNPMSSVSGPDAAGVYSENKGWVAWQTWTPSVTPGTYNQTNAPGIYCITNGALYPYVGNLDVYMCPEFKTKNPTYCRGYSMFSMTLGMASPVKQILFADDALCSAANADSAMVTNDIGRIHGNGSLANANVVYLDGHVEKW